MSFKQSRKFNYREHVYLHHYYGIVKANTTKFQIRIAPNGTDLLLTAFQYEQWEMPATALFPIVAKKLADEHSTETGVTCNIIAPKELHDGLGKGPRFSKTETVILYTSN